MRSDEFNKIEITNEKQLRAVEFGKTQPFEFTSQKENKLPDGELNEKYVGKTIRKQTEVNVQYSNTATAPTHGATTVTSSATASNIAATTATVATAASVVAVAAVAVGTGISIALHDYEYKFNSFEVTSDSLKYELFIVDHNNVRADGEKYQTYNEQPQVRQLMGGDVTEEQTTTSNPEEKTNKEDEKPFTLRVYNNSYDYSIPADLDINVGEFTNLKPKEKYHIVLTENRFGGDTLFDESFTTLEEDKRVSEFKGITWDGKCNFLTMMMDVTLDYQDDFNRFSNFKFNLKSEVMAADGLMDFTYDLKKTTEKQQIKLDTYELFSLAMMYDYSFTYMDENVEVVAKSGTIQFEDNSGAESKFNRFIFDKTANFMNRTFEVQLDFVDDFNVYDNFVLTFYYRSNTGDQQPEEEGFGVDIPLVKTTAVQTVDLDGYEIMLSETYNYKLFCDYYGEKTELASGTATFTDNSGAKNEFYGLTFDKKANFDTRTFEVQMNYKNDLGYLYGFQFILTDLETEEERTFYLTETTEVQTITVDEIKDAIGEKPVYVIDIVSHRMKYTFKYMNNGEEVVVVNNEEFKFKNSLVSTFTGIESPYDFVEEEYYDDCLLPIKFIYNDAARIYQEFEIELYKNNELYGQLRIEDERGCDKWFYAIYDGAEVNHVIEDVLSTNITLKVFARVPSEESQDLVKKEVYSKTVTFTKGEKQEFYDIDFDDGDQSGTITGNTVSFTPIFAGDFRMFDDVHLVFECQSGHTYTLYFNPTVANQIVYETFSGCAEFEEQEEDFFSDFEQPVKITLYYDTMHTEYVDDNNGSGPTTNIVPDHNPKSMVIHESYLFTLSA